MTSERRSFATLIIPHLGLGLRNVIINDRGKNEDETGNRFQSVTGTFYALYRSVVSNKSIALNNPGQRKIAVYNYVPTILNGVETRALNNRQKWLLAAEMKFLLKMLDVKRLDKRRNEDKENLVSNNRRKETALSRIFNLDG